MFVRLTLVAALAAPLSAQIDFARALDAMVDLERLALPADPPYRCEQFASQDRRSVGPEQPGWFSNADGFGREPIPGFAAVLREPGADGIGSYLLADVEGPGVLVRTWSAGMGGVLRVFLDEADQPIYTGAAYDFLARRSRVWLAAAGVALDAGDAFVQQDADYLPVPFARRLRLQWEGNLRELHFYHVQVQRWPAGTAVTTFALAELARERERLARVVATLREPDSVWRSLDGLRQQEAEAAIEPGKALALELAQPGGGAVRALVVRPAAGVDPALLRRVLLRIGFDGAQRPQVEAPLGDFFGTGPGPNPFASLPMSVAPDGTLTCRFVMPFLEKARIELRNHGDAPFAVAVVAHVTPFPAAAGALSFRAKWRVDHELHARGGGEPIDLPYVMLRGRGRLVGAACMLMNPSPIPTPGGNWWGEGDEKIVVDDDERPALFGTGSEDFFNYSWSRPDLFAHPYCGQPLDTGPGTAGYVSNHRFLIADDVPFQRALWFAMELWTHRPLAGLSYARIAYCYAARGALDDHRSLQPPELVVPAMPRFEPVADGGASGATFHYAEDVLRAGQDGAAAVPATWLSRGRYLGWQAQPSGSLRFALSVAQAGEYAVHAVLVHAPDGGSLRASLGGEPLGTVALRSDHLTYARSTAFPPRRLEAGEHELVLECTEPGALGIEYFWLRRQ